MDGYILGHHEGELPTHLLTEGEPGNRVRAMAKLDGPDYNAYYAYEAPDENGASQHVSTVTASGTKPKQIVNICVTESCVGKVANPASTPSFMPPVERYRFGYFKDCEDASKAIAAAQAALGKEHVAAGTDGKGQVLVQLGSNSADELENAAADLHKALGQPGSTGHSVTGGGILRA